MNEHTRAQRNMQIEGLRGVAIVIVLIYHFFCRYLQIFCDGDVKWLHIWGTLGVGFFITVSGYFLIPSEASEQTFALFPYLTKKMLRLWPCYFTAITVIFLVMQLFPLPGRESNWLDYFLNICFLNGFLGTPYVDGAHWYMTTLIAMILIISMARKLHIAGHPLFYISWACSIIALHFIGLGQICTDFGGGYVGYICIAFCLRRFDKKDSALRKFLFLFCALLGSATICVVIGKIAAAELIVIVPIVWLCTQKKLEFLDNKATVFIGKISYSLYLIHQNIGYRVIYSLMEINSRYYIAYGILAASLTILLAVLLYECVEKWDLTQIRKQSKGDSP